MVIAWLAALVLMYPSDDSGLPTPPPALPIQVVNGDGTRMNCAPTLDYCWSAQ